MAEKKYKGAPFGTQTARFDVSGVHPQNKMPGTYTQVPYCRKATSKENRLLGPGTYIMETGDFTARSIEQKSLGPNWERAHDVARLAAIPHMLYREQWEHRRQLEEQLGPGRYDARDFIQEMQSKPSSSRGVCQSRDSRQGKENKFHSNLPGPGTYGKGGVPWAAVEEKAHQAASTVGLLEAGGTNLRQLPTTGSDLAPGQYCHTSPIQELLNKAVSKRGPYDLSTGERNKPAKSLMLNRHLAPGKYELQSFTEDWNNQHRWKHGRFGTVPQYPELPSERIYCSTLSQWPRQPEDPGPGSYQLPRHLRAKSAPSRFPFHSSAIRKSVLTRGRNPVGAGQYDIIRWQRHQHVNGNTSVFVSGTPRLPARVDSPRELLLNERIHPKGLPHRQRGFPIVEAAG